MEETEVVKNALLNMIGKNDNESDGKEFFFPRNVSSDYNILGGMSGKDLVKFLLPPCLLTIVTFIIPPYYNVSMIIIKFFITILYFSIGIIFAVVRPISCRKNIRMQQYIEYRINFYLRQKMFFIREKERMVAPSVLKGGN